MAKSASRAAIVRYEKPTVIVRAPSGGGKVKRAAHRAMGAVGHAVIDEKHMLGAMAGAGALGLAKRLAIPLPGKSIPVLGEKGTAALVMYGVAKVTKNRTARHMATGLACIWLYDLASGATTAGEDD